MFSLSRKLEKKRNKLEKNIYIQKRKHHKLISNKTYRMSRTLQTKGDRTKTKVIKTKVIKTKVIKSNVIKTEVIKTKVTRQRG